MTSIAVDYNPCLGDCDEFISKNRRLVYKIAARYRPVCEAKGIDYEGAVSEGMIGLLLAYRRFDGDRGLKFSTFAYPYITGSISKFVQNHGYIIKPPRDLNGLVAKIREGNMMSYLPEEIAEHFGCSLGQAQRALKGLHLKTHPLEKKITDANDCKIELQDTLPACDDDSQAEVNEFMERLDDRKRLVVKMRLEGYLQTEIAKRLGVTQAHVSRILGSIGKDIKTFFRR